MPFPGKKFSARKCSRCGRVAVKGRKHCFWHSNDLLAERSRRLGRPPIDKEGIKNAPAHVRADPLWQALESHRDWRNRRTLLDAYALRDRGDIDEWMRIRNEIHESLRRRQRFQRAKSRKQG